MIATPRGKLSDAEFVEGSTVYPAYHYQMNQRPLPSEGRFALDGEPEMETTIASLKQHFETVRQREVKRVRRRLGALSSMQESAIESLTQSIIDQILRVSLSVLQAVSKGSDSVTRN